MKNDLKKNEEVVIQESNKASYSTNIIIATLLFSLIYSITRYNIFGGVKWSDFPLFIINKAISLNGIILLIFAFSITPLQNLGVKMSDKWPRSIKSLGIFGFISVFVHFIMSVLLFSPTYYSKFFNADGTLTLYAELSMLFGVLAFVILWFYNLSFYNTKKDKEIINVIKSRGFLLMVMPFTAIHLFFMGYKGWLNPEGWHAGIPPISLVAFVLFCVGYTINIFGRK